MVEIFWQSVFFSNSSLIQSSCSAIITECAVIMQLTTALIVQCKLHPIVISDMTSSRNALLEKNAITPENHYIAYHVRFFPLEIVKLRKTNLLQ